MTYQKSHPVWVHGLKLHFDYYSVLGECTGREIDDRYSLGTAVVMGIDDYVSQLEIERGTILKQWASSKG